ncbi:T9SS type A sorting domain-containing protein [Fibrella sp. HMF5335]|uniref:T9SS type A sorting domain-containing protein n=1 Tax=Fibrella rubiginis TaxID=2817060 RepID=A0A939GH44_9BACT|nr:T9SS type A sorting domain-containing protein [Fibrella rubiginis]MBO0937355.1 T9SS type A sorting domain-containing protein [Fibrella rubiginis]
MNWNTTYRTLLVTVCLSLATLASSLAQTIGIPSISPTAPCPGAPVSATVSTTGSFSAGNIFTLQLSDEFGTFGSVTSVASVTAAPTSATSIVFPATALPTSLNYGTAYRFRVTSNKPTVPPSQTNPISIGTPLPGLATTASFCQNTGNQNITATGNNIEWYAGFAANAPVLSPTGNTYPVSTSLATTGNGITYYATQTLNGCKSAKAAINVTVVAPPSTQPTVGNLSPAYCPTASPTPLSALTNGTGASIRWYSPPSSTTSGGTTLAAPQTTGTYAYTVSQLNAQGCEGPKQFVNVTVYDTPTTKPKISGSLTPQFCSNQLPAVLSATNDGTVGTKIRWTTSGATDVDNFTIAVPNTSKTYQVYQLSANNCPSGVFETVAVSVNTTPGKPTSAYTNDTRSYCAGSTQAAISANANSGYSLKWYLPAAAGGGTKTQSTIDAPTVAGTYAYTVTQLNQVNGFTCESSPLVITVVVKDAPTGKPKTNYPNNSPSYCANQVPTSLEASTDNNAGTFVRWTLPNNTISDSPTVNAPATSGTYQVRLVNTATGCEGPQLAVPVAVNGVPGAPTPTNTALTYCIDNAPATLSANSDAGNKLVWYVPGVTGGQEQTTYPAPRVGGPYAYSVSQRTTAGCEGSKLELKGTVNVGPTTAPSVQNVTYCDNLRPVSLTATTTGTGKTIRWTQLGGSTTDGPTIDAPKTANTYFYEVQQLDANGCSSSSPKSITVTVNGSPSAPLVKTLTLCQSRTTQPLAATATGTNVLTWYDAAGNALTGTPSPAVSATGTTDYFVTQTNGNACISDKAKLTVSVNAVPTKPAPVTPRDYCAGETASALSATGSNLLWYGTDPTGGTGSGQATTPATSTPGVTNYYVTQTVASCESDRQVIPVTVKRKPGLPTAVNNLEFCQNYTAPIPTATAETGASLSWVSGNTASPTPPNVPTNLVQTYTYAVYQTLDGCASDRAPFTVRVKPTPGQPGTTPFQLCQFGPTRSLDVQGTQIKYYDANDQLLGGAPTLPVDQPQTLTYKVTQTLDGCESQPKKTYSVIVYPKPGAPTTQSVQYCLDTQDQPKQTVQPLTAGGQNLRWFFVDGAEFPGAPTPVTSSTSVFDFGVTQTVNNCQSDKATLRVSVLSTPTPVLSSSVVAYCRNDVAKPFEATGENLTWIDPNGVVTNTTPTPPTINAISGATYQVYARGTANGCYSARAKVKLVVNTSPTLALLGGTTINYGQTTNLQLRFTSTPPYAYTLSDGTSGTAVDSLATVAVKPLRTTTYQVANVTNNCGSGLPGNPATAVITVNIPTITTAPLAVTGGLCVGNTFSVGYTTTGSFNTGNAFKVQIADTTSKIYVDASPASLANPLTASLPTTLKGGPYFVRVTATNPGAEVAGANSPTVLTVRALPTATLLGTQNIYETYPANLTVVLTGDAPWAITYSQDGGSPISFNTAASPHILNVQPAKTATYTLGTVTNSCGTGVVSGTAVVTVLPLLAVEEPLNGAVDVYPTPTQAVLTVDINVRLTAENPATLTLTDMVGRPMLTRRVTDQHTQLDLSQQPAGLYLLNVSVGDKRVVRKVMKQ